MSAILLRSCARLVIQRRQTTSRRPSAPDTGRQHPRVAMALLFRRGQGGYVSSERETKRLVILVCNGTFCGWIERTEVLETLGGNTKI